MCSSDNCQRFPGLVVTSSSLWGSNVEHAPDLAAQSGAEAEYVGGVHAELRKHLRSHAANSTNHQPEGQIRVSFAPLRPNTSCTPGAVQPLVEAFTQVPLPFTAIQWIRESPNAKLLARLVADGRPLSHRLLDELPPTRGLHYIRQVMVQTGVLPQRHEDLERVPSWLEHHLADKPIQHANLVHPFLNWFLLRRARNRASARRYPVSTGRDLRRRVLVALELLARRTRDHAEGTAPRRHRPLARRGRLPAAQPHPLLPEMDNRSWPHHNAHCPAHPTPAAGGTARR